MTSNGPNGSSPRVWRNRAVAITRPITRTVHLHVCGEIPARRQSSTAQHGSSPRVWRNLQRFSAGHLQTRFISTCVEKSIGPPSGFPISTVHLHVCGEILPNSISLLRRVGSSPRVWRNLLKCTSPLTYSPVHLHVCGEIFQAQPSAAEFRGSSPRVWRNLESNLKNLAPDRFISTCVEKSHAFTSGAVKSSVHLHVCGEIKPAPWSLKCRSGSSPRVWRNHRKEFDRPARYRFISTCVEKSCYFRSMMSRPTVHLHVCGEI